MKISLDKITTKGKSLFLAYDQGMEHGPTGDFNDKNIDPRYIIKIAQEGKFNAIIFQKGIAEKYNDEIKKSGVPLILKLNGKTNLYKGEPVSAQLATVTEAVSLGAVAVGYTIYIGSEYESEMLEQFETIERDAHAQGIPVIAWIYPRGRSVDVKKGGELLAYACRVGLELGADIVKVHWGGNPEDLKWAVKSAGKTKVVIAGGVKKEEKTLLEEIKTAMKCGVSGIAIGRNMWQSEKPAALTKKIKGIIW